MFATPTRQTRSSSRLSAGRAESANPQDRSTPQRDRAANRYLRSPSQVLRMSPPGTNSRSVLDGKRPPVRIKEETEEEEHSSLRDDAPDATSSTTSFNRSRNNRLTLQPSSFFVRERSNGNLPQQNSFSSAGNTLGGPTNQLLRGAQKPSYDPYSPSHSRTSVGMHSILSSEPDDSRSLAYDYQAEERLAAELEAEEMERSAAGPSRRNGREHSDDDDDDSDDGSDATSAGEGEGRAGPSSAADRANRRRRPRTSKDNLPYRPDSNDEDRDTDGSDGGRKHSHRRRSRNDWPKMREGRDDNKIWCGQKKKRRSPRKKDENGNDLPDDSFAGTTHGSFLDDTPPTTTAADATQLLSKAVDPTAQKTGTGAGQEEDIGSSVPSAVRTFVFGLASLIFSAPLMVANQALHRLQALGIARALTWIVVPLIGLVLLRAATAPSNWGSENPIIVDDVPRSSGFDLFGLLSSRTSSRVLTPPDEPPTSFSDLTDRLTNLEGAFQNEHERVEQRFRAHDKRISRLEDASDAAAQQIERLSAQHEGASAKLDRLESALAARDAKLGEELRLLKGQHDKLEQRTTKDSKANRAERSRLQSQMAKVEAELQRTRSLVEGLGEAQRKGELALAEFRELVKPLQQLLPAQMPVRSDPKTGRIHIEPSFWKELKKVFATIDGDSKFLSVPETAWEGFLRANQAAITELVAEQVDQRTAKVLDRDTFVRLLNNEAERIKVEISEQLSSASPRPDRDALVAMIAPELDVRLERAKDELSDRFNDNVEALQNEILAKVRKQNQMYEEAGSWRPKGAKLPGSGTGSSSSSNNGASGDDLSRIAFGPGALPLSKVDLKLKDGTDLKGSVLALIDAALEHYSADRIGLRDYALYSAGGRIVPEWTTETYAYDPSSSWGARWMPSFGSRTKGSRPAASSSAKPGAPQRAIRGRPPLVALHPDTSPGMCWSFAGPTGSLGVYLSKPTHVTAVSIEHTPRVLSLDEGSSAPREFAVWGIVSGEADRRKLAAHRAAMARRAYSSSSSSSSSSSQSEATGSGDGDDGGSIDAAPPPPSDAHVLLATATYQLHQGARTVQTFSVPADVVALGIKVPSVQFQFLSNHGHPAFTCVYRVRVHGDT
ncbi:uncharacterized protein PFL1_01133 [Pseudozyma flocculosa PF-1]|uniref:uncharacterized protein n=1 Tax=Pseudozyma flocculosa PF-1 TaxID=1277687 RepID=UPI0004560FEA|nr:uncharacterized protein PFL1_01133 [Pseudozyma flocculosa PF-1]EPQ31801.1 hypothetical protein PFL1_01133 [Pseudozyma flocculosa PF-1]